MLSDLELMKIHASVLFQHNTENRITYVNESPFDEAPRVYIGGTKDGYVVRYLRSLSEEVVKELGQTIGMDSHPPLAEIIRILNKDREIQNVEVGPAYIFSNVKSVPTSAVKVTPFNKEILLPNFHYTYEELELKQPCYAIVQNGIAVSLCCSARQTDAAAEASLFTLEEYRGKGYGMEVTIAWALDVQNQGKLALYSTSWDNFSSQTVAKKLQLRQYGMDIHIS
ncbi:GNAT family N-acetyltransferase [Bacillus sp. APMAM]|nr:GNAT family N-acetyltransferase [Bacillus sp. APMAM]RTZ56146.1 GNAT family N-acetyltransferase [Bacillus sp. SAJ1]